MVAMVTVTEMQENPLMAMAETGHMADILQETVIPLNYRQQRIILQAVTMQKHCMY